MVAGVGVEKKRRRRAIFTTKTTTTRTKSKHTKGIDCHLKNLLRILCSRFLIELRSNGSFCGCNPLHWRLSTGRVVPEVPKRPPARWLFWKWSSPYELVMSFQLFKWKRRNRFGKTCSCSACKRRNSSKPRQCDPQLAECPANKPSSCAQMNAICVQYSPAGRGWPWLVPPKSKTG